MHHFLPYITSQGHQPTNVIARVYDTPEFKPQPLTCLVSFVTLSHVS